MPGIGTARDDDIAPGIRSFPVGNYLILYRMIEGGIEVIRIWHGARGLGGAIDRKQHDD
jgi:toxin ParE1/3/4